MEIDHQHAALFPAQCICAIPCQEASRALQAECDPDVVVSLRIKARELHALGEVSLARQIDRRIAALEKKVAGKDSKLRLHLRTEAVKRHRAAEAETEVVERADEEAVRLKLQSKLAALQLQIENKKTTRSTNALRRQELEDQARKVAAKSKAQVKRHLEETVVAYFANELASKLMSMSQARKKELAALAGKRTSSSLPRRLPALWFAGVRRTTLRMVAVHRKRSEPLVYASDPFSLKLFKGKRPQDVHPLSAAPVHVLSRLLDDCLPGWRPLLTARWSVGDLLSGADHIADQAFFHAVWAYSHSVGQHRFPEGLWRWPPKEWYAARQKSKKSSSGAASSGCASAAAPLAEATRLPGRGSIAGLPARAETAALARPQKRSSPLSLTSEKASAQERTTMLRRWGADDAL